MLFPPLRARAVTVKCAGETAIGTDATIIVGIDLLIDRAFRDFCIGTGPNCVSILTFVSLVLAVKYLSFRDAP